MFKAAKLRFFDARCFYSCCFSRDKRCGLLIPLALCGALSFALPRVAAGQRVADSQRETRSSGFVATTRPVARIIGTIREVPSEQLARVNTSLTLNANANSDAKAIAESKALSNVAGGVSTAKISAVVTSDDERRLFELINRERVHLGLKALQWDGTCARAAQNHTLDMTQHNYLSHTGQDLSDPAARARSAGLSGWRALGENIAFNQGYQDPVAFVVERWMKSVKHHDNIANPNWTHTGLSINRAADGTYYFTQLFVQR